MKSKQVAVVSRETDHGPTVGPILFRRDMTEATLQRIKQATRRIVSAKNSHVQPGTFDGLDLDTGRARRPAITTTGKRQGPPAVELRAQCKFESGLVRSVTVTSKTKAGDLLWVKPGRFGARRASTLTLEVTRVGLCRLQDMTDADAIEEGVELVRVPAKLSAATPRERFAWLWDAISGSEGPASWSANPWVWVYHYRMFPENIDDLLAKWERRG